MKKQLLTILVFLLTFLSYGQTTLTLKDCIRIGLEQNYDIRIIRNTQQISDNNLTLGNAGYLPTVDLSSGYNVSGKTTNQFPADGSEKVTTNNAGNQTIDAGVNLNWMIFNGFKVQTNYQRLKELKTAGELNTQLSVENYISNLSAEYYNFVQQNIRLKNLREAVKLSRERLRIVEARYQIGSFSRLDLQQARVDFNTDSSKLFRQFEALNTSRIKLNELMGVKDVDQTIVAADSVINLNTLAQKEELWQKTLDANTLLKLSDKEKKLTELDLKTAQSQNFPYLRLNAGYGLTHFTYKTGAYNKQNTWGPNVGVTLGFNIFDGFNKNREQKNAKIRIDTKILEDEQLRLSLKSDFSNMWMAYQNNLNLTSLEKESLDNAQKNYEIAMDRYRVGDLSGLQLREAQNNLLAAEERLVTAEYNTKLYEISLLQISGQIVEYFK